MHGDIQLIEDTSSGIRILVVSCSSHWFCISCEKTRHREKTKREIFLRVRFALHDSLARIFLWLLFLQNKDAGCIRFWPLTLSSTSLKEVSFGIFSCAMNFLWILCHLFWQVLQFDGWRFANQNVDLETEFSTVDGRILLSFLVSLNPNSFLIWKPQNDARSRPQVGIRQ